jgi:hypothetical protein
MSILPGLNWTNSNIDVFVGRIIEVDMVSAGMTVIKQEQLLPLALIARLEKIDKSKRSIAIGKLSRITTYKSLADKITSGIRKRMEMLLAYNNVPLENVISVKRDAVFLSGIPIANLVLPDGTKFKIKNSYTSMAVFGKIEVYCVPKKRKIDIKGIDDTNKSYHEKYLIEFILDILSLAESGNKILAAKTIQQFRKDYLDLKLPLGFYRSFNTLSVYIIPSNHNRMYLYDGNNIPKDKIDISYNLKNVILPLIRSLI